MAEFKQVGEIMQDNTTLCQGCGSTFKKFLLKLIPTNRQDQYYPKYIPSIKTLCAKCDRYLKFAVQTPELISLINKSIKNLRG